LNFAVKSAEITLDYAFLNVLTVKRPGHITHEKSLEDIYLLFFSVMISSGLQTKFWVKMNMYYDLHKKMT